MTIEKTELEKMYNSMSNSALAAKLGVSIVTLLKLLTDSGIELKGKGGGMAAETKIKVV